jgi:hypothetical protein
MAPSVWGYAQVGNGGRRAKAERDDLHLSRMTTDAVAAAAGEHGAARAGVWPASTPVVPRVITAPTSPALATVVFAVGLLANLVLAESLRVFPFEDTTNNLTRYVMLDRAWFGGLSGPVPAYIQTRFVIGPYLGFDLIGAALVHVFGPSHALRVIAAVVVMVIPVGGWLLLRATGRANVAWSLVGVLIGMGFFTVVGFLNYTVGFGAALVWLAIWWPSRAEPSRWRMAGLCGGIVALYLLHLSAPLIVLVVLWVDVALTLVTVAGTAAQSSIRRRRGDTLRLWLRTMRAGRRYQFAIGATAAFALTCLAGGIGAAPPGHGAAALVYPSLGHKLANILSPFYVFSYGQAAISIAVYGVMVVAFLLVNRTVWAQRGRWSVFAASAIVFLVLFFVFPAGTPGTGYLDMRWLPPAFLLPLAAAEADGVSPSRGITLLMLVGCLVHDAVLGRSMQAIDHELANFRVVLDELPADSRVLSLVADGDRHGLRVFPYRHFAFWHVIDRGGRVSALLNGAGEGGGRPQHSFMAHFIERDHLYLPGEGWGTTEFTPLDWVRIGQDYDYIIEAGSDPRATRLIAGHAQALGGAGDVALFRVRPGG